MRERGFEMIMQHSKSLRDVFMKKDQFTYVITVCDDVAEHFPPNALSAADVHIHWNFPDLARFEGTEQEKRELFQSVRDQIDEQIMVWLSEIRILEAG